jgi:hypothetical protein
MSDRPVKPKEYFAKLLSISEDKIDYADSPPTSKADWRDAEVLFPLTAEEFRWVKDLVLDRRKSRTGASETNGDKIKRIALLGEEFPAEYLFVGPETDDPLLNIGQKREAAKKRSEIEQDWYIALQFFLSKVFYRNLPDQTIRKFFWNAMKVLDVNREQLLDSKFNPGGLDQQMVSEGVPFGGDRLMVIAAVEFARDLGGSNNNIVSYSVDHIRSDKIVEVHNTLDDLSWIGPKKIGVFLKNIVLIWKLDEHLKTNEDIACCIPVDTHVRQTCELIGIAPHDEPRKLSDKMLARRIVDACREKGVSPLYFDMGAWRIGMARTRKKAASLILRKLQAGVSEAQIRAEHPRLDDDDFRAAETARRLAELDLPDLVSD